MCQGRKHAGISWFLRGRNLVGEREVAGSHARIADRTSVSRVSTADIPGLGLNVRSLWIRLRSGTEGLIVPLRAGDSVNLYLIRVRRHEAADVMLQAKPTGHLGTIGIVGLGQWQLLCRRMWLRSNCSLRPRKDKMTDARSFRAPTLSFKSDVADIPKLAGPFDLLLAMVKVPLDLPALINALAPNGHMHFVGVTLVPIIGEESR
jgi:hypothetical protein